MASTGNKIHKFFTKYNYGSISFNDTAFTKTTLYYKIYTNIFLMRLHDGVLQVC